MGMTEKLPKNRKEIFKKFNRFLKDKRIYKAYYRNLYDSRNDSDNAFRVNYCGSMEDFFFKMSGKRMVNTMLYMDKATGRRGFLV